MRKFRAILLGAMLALGLLGAATPVDAACSAGKVTLADGLNGGGSHLILCTPGDISNLANLSGGPCVLSWGDCLSSLRLTSGTGAYVCLWTDAGFSGSGLRVIGPYPVNQTLWYNLPSTWNNHVSSIEWGINCLTD